MHKAKQVNSRYFDMAIEGLEKGWNPEDFKVMSQALDNMVDMAKLGKYVSYEDMTGTDIDNNIRDMNKYFSMYVSQKKDYQIAPTDMNKGKCIESLDNFLYAMMKIMEELKTSSDFAQERDMIKGKLREMFALYQ